MRLKVLLVSDNPGRLGNLLNRHGHLLAYAIEHGCILIDVTFFGYARMFPRLHRNVLRGRPFLPFFLLPEFYGRIVFWLIRKLLRFAPRLERLSGGAVKHIDALYPAVINLESEETTAALAPVRIAFLTGYLFEATEFFKKHAEAIRQQFAFPKPVVSRERAYLESLREKGAEIVGVHIRHTDYRTYCDGRWFYTVQQYADVMRWYAAQQSPRPVQFVICSDEKQSPEDFAGLSCSIHAGDYLGDLCVLSLCDRLISTKSSFSRAAAFLGNQPLLQIFDPGDPSTHSFTKIEALEEGWTWHTEMLKRHPEPAHGS